MQIEEALEFVFETAKNRSDSFDAIGVQSNSEGLSVFKQRVQDTEISNSVGVGIRVFCNGRPGYAFTERLEKEALRQMIDDAVSHTPFTKQIEVALPFPKLTNEQAHNTKLYASDVEQFRLEDMKALCLEIESRSYAESEIENVPYLGAEKSESSFYIINSNGLSYSRKRNSLGAGVSVLASRNGVKKLGSYSQTVRNGQEFNVDKISKEAVRRAKELLGARAISSGLYPVVFSEDIAGNVISLYASSFCADVVQKGSSRLLGKEREKIAASCFTLTDDPTREDLPGFTTFDGEGVQTARLEIISNGVLNGFLHNLETAAKAQIKNSGNAVRSYSGNVACGFSNLVVSPGTLSTQELLAQYPKAMLITKLEGNSGCSAVSGELSIGAQGFYYENGERKHPVEGLTLGSNFFDLILQLDGVGSKYNDFYSSIRVPALAVSKMKVSN